MHKSTVIAISVLALAFSSSAAAQSIQINRENKTIAVTTKDEAIATANIAAVNIGFDIYASDSAAAYANGAHLSKAIMDALHRAGIDDKSIESDTQNLGRNRNLDENEPAGERARKQFEFEQSWEVSTNPKNAAEVIRLAIAAGANTSGKIDWRLSDRKALQAQAAANALIKARAVASQMAEGLHVKLGELIYASNESPDARFYLGTSAATVTVTASGGGGGGETRKGPPLEIRPQTIREEATVYAVFAIE